MKNIGLILVYCYILYVIFFSIRKILIGKNKINHILYDTEEKRKKALVSGYIGLILMIIFGGIFSFLTYLAFW